MNFARYNRGDFNSGTYGPANESISDITQANNAVVTTDEDHSFVVGNQVQFSIPPQWGMTQLNGLKGFVLDVPAADEIQVDINTTFFNPFVTPTTPPFVVIDNAQVSPVGDQNFGNLSPGGIPELPITIPGAFINTPP